MDRAEQIRKDGLWVSVALFVAIVAVYARSLGNQAVWDDKLLVVENPYLTGWSGLVRLFTSDLWTASAHEEPSSFYRPLTMLTFWINVAVGGRSAASLRLGNILIHAANGVLIALLLRKMRVATWRWAGILAAAWAIAPICSEPVLWISGRFDPLVLFFALSALLAARLPRGAALSLVAMACGILSKETFIVWLPIVVLDDLFVRRIQAGASFKVEWPKYAGMLMLVTGYFIVRRLLGLPSAAVAIHTGARTVVESFFFLVATFVRILVWPTTLDPYRPYAPLSPGALAVTVIGFTAIVAACAAWIGRQRTSTTARVAAFGLVWFTLATLPCALVGPNLDMVGDRYAYLPMVGLLLMVGALVEELRSRAAFTGDRSAMWQRASVAGAAVVLTGDAWLTIRHTADWGDDITLARSSLASSPGNSYALQVIATDAAQRGDFADADALLAEALQANRESWRTWNALCFVRLRQDRLDEAEQACRESLSRHSENPRGWVNLASIYVRRGHWRDAAYAAERAVALKPRYGEARYLAAVASANLGNIERAQEHLARGIEIDPDNARLRDLERQFQARLR